MNDYSNLSDEELDKVIASGGEYDPFGGGAGSAQANVVQHAQTQPARPDSEVFSGMSDADLDRVIESGGSWMPDPRPAPPPVREDGNERRQMSDREFLDQYYGSTGSDRQDNGGSFMGDAIDALSEGMKGRWRATKALVKPFVGLGTGALRLEGTRQRLFGLGDGLHRIADSIDDWYDNFGAGVLESEIGVDKETNVGTAGEKIAGTAGSLASLAMGGAASKLGAAGKLGKASEAAAVGGTALQKALPYMFGNDAAVRTYETAKDNGSGTARALGLAGVNGAIHFLGFKLFENKSLNKMLGMPAEMEAMMPKWAGEAGKAGANTFSGLTSGVRNGMFKYILAERAKGALKAGGIMGLQNFLSSLPTQAAEGGDIDWARAAMEGAEGVGEGALMEGLMGGASALLTPRDARNFISNTYFRNGYTLPNGQKVHGLLHSREGRMFLMKQNPEAQADVINILEHGGKLSPAELDAACLPPDMTEAEQRKFAKDWRRDIDAYTEEAWNADAPRNPAKPPPHTGRYTPLSADEADTQQREIDTERAVDEAWDADNPNRPAPPIEAAEPSRYAPLSAEEAEAQLRPKISVSPAPDEAPNADGAQEQSRLREEATKRRESAIKSQGDTKAVDDEINGFFDAVDKNGDVLGNAEFNARNADVLAEVEDAIRRNNPQMVRDALNKLKKKVKNFAKKKKKNRLRPAAKADEAPVEQPIEQTEQPKEVTNETGNVPVEAQPEPPVQDAGRGGLRTPPQAADGSVEGEAPRGEVPAAGEVAEAMPASASATKPAVRATPAPTQETKPVEQKPVSKSDKGGQKLTGGAAEVKSGGRLVSDIPVGEVFEYQGRKMAKTADGGLVENPTVVVGKDGKPVVTGKPVWERIPSGAVEDAVMQADRPAAEPPKTAPASAPRAESTTTPPQSAEPVQGTESAAGGAAGGATEEPKPTQGNKLRRGKKGKKLTKQEPKADAAPAAQEDTPAPTAAEQAKPASQYRDKNGGMKKTLRRAVERIASSIGNRTGKGAITPDEADGIVNGIAESPEVKHNRTVQFFNPLVTDAEWQNSLGVDAESAKNIRDAVVRAKTDREMAHFFVQVDKAVKKAKAGKLSQKDAVPLYGKISEGLEKAEREGRDAAAQRLREAVEVIKPVADAVTQEDVNQFNRSAKGKKLHTQLDGSDRRRGSRGKTVSLDTKDGTIDVGADGRKLEDVVDEISGSSHDRRILKPGESYGKGFTKESDNDTTGTEGARQGSTGKGGNRGGNRVLRIEEIDGDDVFVSLLDSTGRERGEPQKMTREQWETLAKAGKSLNDADPSNPQVGDNIMMSRGNAESPADRDAKFAADADYQRWLKSRKANDAEPLRQRYEMEQAKALGNAFKNAVGGVDFEYVDRDYDPAKDNPNGGRELKDRDTGTVLGIFDRDTGKLKLFRGASWKTLNHEFGHATMRYAEQEAARGNRALLDKINESIDNAPQWLKDDVRRRYPDADEATLRDEIWAALRERPSEAMQKYVKTLQGRRWHNRAWDAIKTAWRGILSRMGFNRADLSGIDKMTPDEFNEFLDKAMIGGKTLGRIETASPQSSVRMARGPVTPGPDVRIMDDEVKWLDRQSERFVDSTHNLRKVQGEVGYRDRSDPKSVGVEEVMDPKTGFVDWRKSSDIQKAIVKSNGFVQKNEHILQVRRDRATREMAKMKGLSEDAKRELVDNYLTALHAEERNRTIADRRGDAYNDDYAEGAGRSAKWARDFIANDPNVQKYKAELDRIADIVHEAVVEDLRLRHENGLLSDDEYNFYSKKWKHYVPLRTDMTEGSPEGGAFNTSTATFNRSEYRTAKGRGADNIASSPFAFAFVQAHDGIGKSAKNIIGNVTKNFIDMTEAKGLNSTKVEVVAKDGSKSTKTEYRIAEVVPADVVKRGGTKFAATFADGTTAEIGSDMRLASHQDNLVLFKRPEPVIGNDGKPTGKTAARLYVAKFTEGKNGKGLAVAKAITGKNMVDVPFWVQPFSKATHFLSRMNTSASPSFLTSNIFNDRNEAWRAMSARFGVLDGAKMAAKVWKYRYADADSKDLKNWLENGELRTGSDVADFINGGAAIKGGNIAQGFSGETSSLKDNLARQERKARSWLERFKRIGRFENVREIASSVGDVVEFANELEELGTRYGVYHAVLDELVANGVPREVAKAEAVTFCRGATTDFNVRGTLAPVIGSFYMFYNANVQGTRRNLQSLTDKRGVQTFATLAAVASAMTVLRYWLGNDEEREKGGGRNAKNALEYQKQSAMGIPIPSGRELSILKMRGVDALIPYAATKFTEAALYDDVGAMEALADSLEAAGGEALGVLGGNGIGNKSQISQTLAPSLADPFVQWATGTDWQGERRVKQLMDKTVPQSYNARHGTSDVFKWIAETVNDISGGNQYRKGLVDMAPEDVQLIVETLAGGLGRDITGAINTFSNVKEVAKGGSSERLFGRMPVVKSLVREYPDSTSRYFDALDEYDADKAEFKKTTELGRRAEMKKEHPYLTAKKGRVDALIEQVQELTHRERGEVKVGQKWVPMKTELPEARKEAFRKRRLRLQAEVLRILGK